MTAQDLRIAGQVIERRQLARDHCAAFRNGIADCRTCDKFDATEYQPEENVFYPACPAHPILY